MAGRVELATASRGVHLSRHLEWRPAAKKMRLISAEEIQEAVRRVVDVSLGAVEDEVAAQVSRLLGFGALWDEARQIIRQHVARLEQSGVLERRGECLLTGRNRPPPDRPTTPLK